MSDLPPTLLHAFADALEAAPGDTAITLVERSEESSAISRKELHRMALAAAGIFREQGIGRGERIVIALPTSREFFAAYIGALVAGVIPLVVPSPRPGRPMEIFAESASGAGLAIGARHILLPDEYADPLSERLGMTVIAAGSLAGGSPAPFILPDAGEVAHLQATSGSTGSPKFAMIRHANSAANVYAIGRTTRTTEDEVVVSWLPCFHDMGLIAVHCALQWGRPLVATDPANFVRNPINFWLRLFTRFRGTMSPAPNSAYQICARLARLRRFDDLDLSTWRVGYCGAEPIHESTLREFQDAFGPYGLRRTTLLPVYGLAEATLAVSIPDVDAEPHAERIDAGELAATGRSVPAAEESGIAFVSVGSPIAGHRLRIVDERGEEVGERRLGELEFAGPSVIDGYWENPEATRETIGPDGFLRTGDLGYMADGELYIVQRKKDIIIIGGRNFVPSQIEALVEKVAGEGRINAVAAIGMPDHKLRTEMLHLIIESRTLPPPGREETEGLIRSSLSDAFGLGGAVIHWVNKGSIPKTTSGKIQRYRCREIVGGEIVG